MTAVIRLVHGPSVGYNLSTQRYERNQAMMSDGNYVPNGRLKGPRDARHVNDPSWVGELRDQWMLLRQILHDYRSRYLPSFSDLMTSKEVAFVRYMECRIDTIQQQINSWETFDGRDVDT